MEEEKQEQHNHHMHRAGGHRSGGHDPDEHQGNHDGDREHNEKRSGFSKFIKDIGTFPNYLFIALFVLTLLLQFIPITQFKHIPGPPYGGDLYRERGFTLRIMEGEPFYSDPYIPGEYAFYPTGGYVIAAGFAWIFSLSVDTTLIYFSFLMTPLFFLALYMLGKELFHDKHLVIIMASSFFATNVLINMKHTISLGMVIAFFFLAYFVRINKQEEKFFSRNKLMAGILLGLAALCHYTTFIAAGIIIGSTVLFEFLYLIVKKKQKIASTIKQFFMRYSLLLIIGFLISLIFFYPIIFKYHFQTPNPTNEYSLMDVNKLGLTWPFLGLFSRFFNSYTIPFIFIGIIASLGLILAGMNLKKTEYRLVFFWLIGIFLATAHYLITKPLFDFSIIPGHVASAYQFPIFILFVMGVQFVLVLVGKFSGSGQARGVTFIVVFAILVAALIQNSNSFNNDQWTKYGKSMDAGTKVVYDIGDWMLKNTNSNDVILANDESSFMLNGMSGRSVVLTRRVHASAYVDMEKRYADGIAMLYCKDNKTVENLLKDYNVTYFYLDQFLVSYPIVADKKYGAMFDACGIAYSVQNVPLDTGGPDSPLYWSLVVPPQNLTILPFLEIPPKQFIIPTANGNQLYSEIYKIKR